MGLIPAHAGKTCSWSCLRAASRAHPRSRGENDPKELPGVAGAGSSPLTRGKRPRIDAAGAPHGLIPAHAGKTGAGRRSACRCRAHPRSRGENLHERAAIIGAVGSSPLTRGKRARLPRPSAGSGLIPAHAGKTSIPGNRPVSARAHPRSRGENISPGTNFFMSAGSSPLTRGKLIR